jgi:hypothetical protein
MKAAFVAAAVALLAAGCGAGQEPTADTGPAGDIPDSQAFVAFTPASGALTIDVPEGWARTDSAAGVTFTDKLNSVVPQSVPAAAAPTVDSARAQEPPALRVAAAGYHAGDVRSVSRAGGSTVLITYQADATPDTVTGKVRRDEVQRCEFWRNGAEEFVVLSGPVGADGADPSRRITDPFRWR